VKPLNAALAKLSPAEIKKLESENLIASEEYADSASGKMKRDWYAAWTMRVKFYWTQRFPANQTVELTQAYRPVVGGSYIPASDNGGASVKPYCGGPQGLREIAILKQLHPAKNPDDIALWERTIKYILTTANNWDGSIRKFHLKVTGDSAEDIVVTCMPGLKRSGDASYELSHTDWRPTKDLDLLILQANKPEGR
jgi:hypothetical protein